MAKGGKSKWKPKCSMMSLVHAWTYTESVVYTAVARHEWNKSIKVWLGSNHTEVRMEVTSGVAQKGPWELVEGQRPRELQMYLQHFVF